MPNLPLLFIDKVKQNQKEFEKKVLEVSKNLSINPNWLMYIMYHESGINPSIRNKNGGATGLIQFMPSVAVSLGTTTDSLAQMSNVQQMDYVQKFFWSKRGQFKSVVDMYLFTFYPYAIGKPDDYIFGSERGIERAKLIAKVNWHPEGKDVVSLGEWKQHVIDSIKTRVPVEYHQNIFSGSIQTDALKKKE